MKIARNGEWLGAMIGTECVMMCIENGNFIELSRVGTRIWELIQEPMELSHICVQLCDEFDVSEDVCRVEVESFIAELQELHAVVSLPPNC